METLTPSQWSPTLLRPDRRTTLWTGPRTTPMDTLYEALPQ